MPAWLLLVLLHLSLVPATSPASCPAHSELGGCECGVAAAGLEVVCRQSSRDQVSGALHRPALLQCAEQVGRARAATIPRALHSLRLENPRPELTALPAWLLANLSISHLVVARSRVSQERNRKKWIYSAIDLHREKYFGY